MKDTSLITKSYSPADDTLSKTLILSELGATENSYHKDFPYAVNGEKVSQDIEVLSLKCFGIFDPFLG